MKDERPDLLERVLDVTGQFEMWEKTSTSVLSRNGTIEQRSAEQIAVS